MSQEVADAHDRLPPALRRLVKPVDPRHGRRTHITNPVRRGQRCDVPQEAGGPIVGQKWGKAHREVPSASFTISWASLTRASRWPSFLKLSA